MNAVSCQRAAPEQPLLTTGLHLVEAIARQVRASLRCSHPHDDMVSFGNEGLVEALNRFEPERGIPFNAFASQRIRGAIIDGMRREGRMTRRAWERASESMADCQIGPAEYDDEALLDDCWGLSPEEVVIKCEESRSVNEVIDDLAPEHAELVRRFYGEGGSLREISQDLGYAPGWGSKAIAVVHDRIRGRLDRQSRQTRFAQAAAVHPAPAPGSLQGGRETESRRTDSARSRESSQCSDHETRPNRLPRASEAGPAQALRLPSASEAGTPQALRLPRASEAGPAQASRLPSASEASPAQASRLPSASEAGPPQALRLPRASEAGPAQASRLLRASEAGPPQASRLPRASEAGPAQALRLLRASEAGPAQALRLPRASEAGRGDGDNKSTDRCRLHAIHRPLWPIGRSETRGTHYAASQPMRTVMSHNEIVNAILARRNVNKAAYETAYPEAAALQANAIRVLNADVPTVVSRVVGAVPKILAMREEIQRQTPQVHFHKFQKLETYAFALSEAHVHCLTIGKSPDELRALAEEASTTRDIFRADAFAMAKRGLIDGSRLEGCQGQPGYKTISLELDMLVEVFQDNWPKIKGKCGISEEELERAIALSQALVVYVGAREQSPEAKARAIDIRDRMFTLVVDNYDEARRVATFLRWGKGDVDELVPSLFAGRSRRRGEEEDEDQNKVPPVDPGNQNTTPVNVNPPSNNATPGPVPGNGSGNVTPANQMFSRPNSDPFMR